MKHIAQTWRGCCTVKPVYNDHPQYPKIVAVVDGWSLFGGRLCYKRSYWDLKTVAVVDKWLLFRSGRYLRFDCISDSVQSNRLGSIKPTRFNLGLNNLKLNQE